MNILVLVIMTTLIVSALCSLFEATLFSTRHTTLESAKKKGRHQRTAALFLAMKKNVGAPTAAILILNTTANTAGATVAGMLVAREFGADYVLAFSGALTLTILLFSEIVPKTYGAVHWRRIWPYIVWPLAAIQRVLSPLIWLTQKLSNLLVAKQPVALTTQDEVLAMIQSSAQSGQLTSTELELLTSVFHFDDIICRQVMVPRNDVDFLKNSWPVAQCIEFARQAQHTRYPLVEGSFETPVGIIHIKDLLGIDLAVSIDSVARPVHCVPETMLIAHLLREMQNTGQHMAIVVDEHGSAVGLVTMEDMVEVIIGSVQDEFDDEAPELAQAEPGTYRVRGTTLVLSVNRHLSLNLPHSHHVDTLSGLLVKVLGRLLREGDIVELEGVRAEVIEVMGNRATQIRLTLVEPPDDGEASGQRRTR